MGEKTNKLVKSIFSVDNAFVRACERVLDLLILNLLFLLSCLPLVTIGVAKMALYQVSRDLKTYKRLAIVSSYLEAFKKNFRKGLGLGLVELVLSLVCLIDLWLVGQMGLPKILPVIFMAGFLLNLALFLYVYPLAQAFELEGKELFKMAFLLSGLQFPWTFLMVGVLMGLLVLLYSSVLSFLVGISFLLLWGFACLGYGWACLMEIIYKKYPNQLT